MTIGIADFTATPTTGPAPLTVQFQDTTSGTGGVALCQWSYGDDTYQAYISNPTHEYAVPGVYSVSLTDSVEGGDQWVLTKQDLIVVTAPVTPRHITRALRINRTF